MYSSILSQAVWATDWNIPIRLWSGFDWRPSAETPPHPAVAKTPPPAAPVPEPQEDLLDSLELQPGDSLPAMAPVEAEEPEVLDDEELEIDVDGEGAFDTPQIRLDPRSTLVAGKKEAEDLRRRIGVPPAAEESLEDLEDEVASDEEIEALSFEEEPPAPPPPSRAPVVPPRAPSPSQPARNPEGSRTIPPVPAGPSAASPPLTPQVTLDVPAGGGATDVVVPIEVVVSGNAPTIVNVRIRLVLNVKSR
jgi:hypothetical protein